MTHIKKLLLQGFKSFANPTELVLERGLNVVVGPNGAGKSNLADAICFVLGRLSVKSMRAMKASNLIFHGGQAGKPAQEAKVKIVFDNSDNSFSLPDNEIAVSRIVRRNGSSIYKINNETKTRQEVLELLSQAGVDPYGFNIVLQTEIDQFVKMHSEERREIIEDIAGIRVYEERKEKSLHELEKTENKLKEIQTILNERTAFLRNLDKEREQALKYENLKKAIRKYKACLLYKKITEKQNISGKFNSKIEEKQQDIDKINKKVKTLNEEINQFKNEILEIDKHIKDKSGLEQETLFKEITSLKSEDAVIGVRYENYRDQLNNLEKRNEQLNNDLGSTIKELEKLGQEEIVEEEELDFKSEFTKITKQLREVYQGFSQVNEFIKTTQGYLQELQKLVEEKDVYNMSSKVEEIVKNLNKECNKAGRLLDRASMEKIERLEKALQQIDKPRSRDVQFEIDLAKKDVERIKKALKENEGEKKDILGFIDKLKREKGIKEREVNDKEKIGKKVSAEFQKMLDNKSKLQEEQKEKEKTFVEHQANIRAIESESNNLKIEKARIDAEFEALSIDFQEFKDIEDKIKESSRGLSRFDFENKLRRAELELVEIGSVNLRALEVYDRVKAEYDEVLNKVNKLQEEKTQILKIIEEVDKRKKQTFMDTFSKLNENFNTNFVKLSDKGQAILELENKDDPFSGGVDIIVKISKNKEHDVAALSGGEKVIVALAFILSIQEFKPYCFYIFDEIDAALDKHNSERLTSLLKTSIGKSQYIVISHNDATIGNADTLYGATMHEGISKVISLKV